MKSMLNRIPAWLKAYAATATLYYGLLAGTGTVQDMPPLLPHLIQVAIICFIWQAFEIQFGMPSDEEIEYATKMKKEERKRLRSEWERERELSESPEEGGD